MPRTRLTRIERFERRVMRTIARIILFLLDPDLIGNKLCAIALLALTLPCIALENDATATVFIGFFAVPMFFSKDPWIYF